MPSLPLPMPFAAPDPAVRALKLNGDHDTSAPPDDADVSSPPDLPSPPLPTALPARSDSLTHRQSAMPDNDAKRFPPRAHSMVSPLLSSPQSTHPTIASRSISVSDRSSNGDTFSSLGSGSYLSSKSSKSSFAWDVPTRNQSISGKRTVQELAPVEEKNRSPSPYQNVAPHNVTQPPVSGAPAMDVASQDYGDESFEEEATPTDQIIYEILSHIKRIPDIVAAAQVNTGFYTVFYERGLDLIRSIVFDTSPPAWEYMETAYSKPEHPSSYLRDYRRCLNCLSAVKSTLFLRGESTLKPATMDGLMGVNHEKEQQVDAALWRIWTFCDIFGGQSGRDKDTQPQMAWLQQGSDASVHDKAAHFGVGNGKGLCVPELLLMAELWNALSTLLQESFCRPSQDHRHSLFAQTDAQYPAELYLLEWVSHVMTFGLQTISVLASGSFEEAENLGFTNWPPPREFGTRQAFLKTVVAQTYRRRLQQEAEAKATAAGLSMTATHRALATTKRRPIVRPAGSSESDRNPSGSVPRKSVGSGSTMRVDKPLPPTTPQLQPPPPIPQYNVARPRHPDVPPYHPERNVQPRQAPNYLGPDDVHRGMVSFLDPETRPGSTVNTTLSPYGQQSSPSLSGGSEHSYRTQTASSPPSNLSERRQLPPSSHKYAVVDPVDKALALLVDEMGFSLAASKKALAASDDGSGLDTEKAIAILQESVSASRMEKIPVIDDKHSVKPSARFGAIKFKFSSKALQPTVAQPLPPVAELPPQPAPPKRTFGELRPTKKEREAYANLSNEEAKGIKSDVFRAKVYREAFGNLFQGGRDEKARKGSNSTLSAAEVGGRPLSPVESWSMRSLDVESISSKRRVTSPASADARSMKS